MNLSREREIQVLAGIYFFKHCLLSSVKERMMIKKLKMMLPESEPAAAAVAVGNRLLGSQDRKASWFRYANQFETFKLILPV